MAEEGNSTIVLGFDALDFRYLDLFADALDHFPDLRDDGTEGPLRSTHPPWTGSAWPSVYTGTDPSHHGIYAFFDYGHGYPDTADLIDRNQARAPAVWNYLTAEGDPAIVMNVPVTHPAERIEGVLLPGYLATEDVSGYPPGIRDELADVLGEPYRVYSEHEKADDDEQKLAGFRDLVDQRARAARYLLETYDWQLAVLQVQKTDTVFHDFSDREAFRTIYRAADRVLGTVRAVAPDANIVVCSDHGIGPTDGYQIFVNEVLRQHGYLEATEAAERPSLPAVKGDLVAGGSADEDAKLSLAAQAMDRGVRSLRRIGVSPGALYRAAKAAGLEPLVRTLLPDGVVSAAEENVDWRASTAFVRIGSELGVRINLQGREPDGVVPESEYERVRTDLIELLTDLRTPDGDRAFEFVARREQVYEGPYADRACDIVFRPAGMNHAVLTGLFGTQFVENRGYQHKPRGVFIGAGPAFEQGTPESTPSLPDVAPTAMTAAGYDVPERMTGKVPAGVLDREPTRRSYGAVQWGTDEKDERGTGAVEERLEELGYL